MEKIFKEIVSTFSQNLMKTINTQIQKLHEPRKNLKKTPLRNITLNLARTSDERRAEQSRIEENRIHKYSIDTCHY